MYILELKNVSLTYHSLNGETEALKNISFGVNEKEFVAIVGPSGCGKTTILSIISGLLKPTSGELLITEKQKKYVGYMFQRDHLFEWRNIWQNVTLGLEIQRQTDPEKYAYVKKLIEKYGLNDFKESYPRQLSGGMRQRVALIRTLALDPKILLLDEPFSALDYQTRLNVADDVRKIIEAEQKTAILITHDIAEAVSLADRIIVLSNRPAKIKNIFTLDLDKSGPLKRRQNSKFGFWFDKIWKELNTDEK